MVIAIDGPAGAGKSTVARALAERLGFTYLDSGAMYRCVALAALRAGADPDDPARSTPLAEQLDLRLAPGVVAIGGEDVSAAIRAPEVSAAASRVSVHPGVREAMVERQRALVAAGGWVAEGRDIGTVVCPDSPLKVYLTASEDERARRRARRERRGRGRGPRRPARPRRPRPRARARRPRGRRPTRSRSTPPASASTEVVERIAGARRRREACM